VCLSADGRVLASRASHQQRDQAAVIAPYVAELFEEAGISPSGLDAVAITGGPGSYTGLRVSAASAKGLCYALDVPLIAVPTLEVMAGARVAEGGGGEDTLYCPVIEARRMDVFGALYDSRLELLVPPGAMTLDEHFLAACRRSPVEIFGTGMEKCEKVFASVSSWRFIPFLNDASQLVPFSEKAFREKRFEDLAYFDPYYLKAFYQPGKPA
jgi:tRNA threonylcarbamoyladenosine biosynthesis protein TsaB